jgi:hypothetical protein
LSLLLSFLNSAMMGFSDTTLTTGEFLDLISGQIAAQPVLPVADQDPTVPSRWSVGGAMLGQVLRTQSSLDPPVFEFDALLSPFTVDDLYDSTLDTLFTIPGLRESGDVYVFIDDAALQNPIVRDIVISTTTGEQIGLADIVLDVYVVGPGPSEPWLSATPVLIAGEPNVRIDLDIAAISELPNGAYSISIDIFSTTGEYAPTSIGVLIEVFLAGN